MSKPEITNKLGQPKRLQRGGFGYIRAWGFTGLGIVIAGVLSAWGVQGEPPAEGARGAIIFERDVFPILSTKCFGCHSESGGGGKPPESGLRLDIAEGMLRGGESGEPAIVPGDGDGSLLVRVARWEEEFREMPPKGERLTAAQIETLVAWIDQGAKRAVDGTGAHWHWAYRAPERGEPPTPSTPEASAWVRNAIDPFVLAKLELLGRAPSPEADRPTLIRRLSLDLVGLPPTVEEVDAFVNDSSDQAYERIVDRLLASEHFGEKWARSWLDLARYADSNGYEKDGLRVMWPYRDWVIGAFNRDLPFDRFTIEQLAGDMLEHPTLAQRVATGFHRNTQINEEGGTDPEEFRVEAVLDRTNTTVGVWLGMTLQCAQCHDHKYDPLTQKDYFRFYSFFNQDAEDAHIVSSTEKRAAGPMTGVPTMEHGAEFDRLMREATAARARWNTESGSASPGFRAWVAQAGGSTSRWMALSPSAATGTNGVTLTIQDDGSIIAEGENPATTVSTVDVKLGDAVRVSAIRLEALSDQSTPSASVGRAGHGNFVVSDLSLVLIAQDGSERGLPLDTASADYWQGVGRVGDEWPASGAIDANPATGWAIAPEFTTPHELVATLGEPLDVEAGSVVRVRVAQEYGGQHTLARYRLSVTSDRVPALPVPKHLRALVGSEPAVGTPEDAARLLEHYRGIAPDLRDARREFAALEARVKSLTVANAMIMGAHNARRPNRVFVRGSFLTPGDEVDAGVPRVLARVSGEAPSGDRLGLARWIVDPKNPLTARVQANRIWAQLWGRGLIETEEDLGTQGDPPTHPELLDWLAKEFVRTGWSQKRMIRLIVTSAAYRQSSRVTPELLEVDPYNRLLTRGARFRVEAELVRDVALHVSGLLSDTVGGPSVFPPQPPGVWTQIYSGDQWRESTGKDRYRRGLYTFWRRTSHYPTFGNFDAPSREVACSRRPRTNTPLQALTTLNDPQFVEAAGALAVRLMREGGGEPASRVTRGLRLAIGRTPTNAEVARLVALFESERSAYLKDGEAAAHVVKAIPVRTDGLVPAELAAWTIVASVILNLDETLTRS